MTIQKMFDFLAPGYDLFNKLASIFLDGYWRKYAVSRATGSRNILDVCTGTGELAFLLAAHAGRGAKVTGIDFSPEMLKVARRKLNGMNVEFLPGNAENIPFPGHTFDCVTSGFAMRNVSNSLDSVLKEMHRVLKADGRVIILEMSIPHSGLLRRLYYVYLWTVIYALGLIVYGRREPFRYLADSIMRFHGPEQFSKKLEAAGFNDVRYFPLTCGVVCVHTGVKRLCKN